MNDTRYLISGSTKSECEEFQRDSNDLTEDQWIEIMTLLSGGHMRSVEYLRYTLMDTPDHCTILNYIDRACDKYFQPNIYGAILLSLQLWSTNLLPSRIW